MQTCPQCNGSGQLTGDVVDNAHASYRVASNPLLLLVLEDHLKRHPDAMNNRCTACKGTGEVDGAQIERLRHARMRGRAGLVLLVMALLAGLALAAWWAHGQFQRYG